MFLLGEIAMQNIVATLKNAKGTLYKFLKLRLFGTSKGVYVKQKSGGKNILRKLSPDAGIDDLEYFIKSLPYSQALTLCLAQNHVRLWETINKPDSILLHSVMDVYINCPSQGYYNLCYPFGKTDKALKRMIIASPATANAQIIFSHSTIGLDDLHNPSGQSLTQAPIMPHTFKPFLTPDEYENKLLSIHCLNKMQFSKKFSRAMKSYIIPNYVTENARESTKDVAFSPPFLAVSSGMVLQFCYPKSQWERVDLEKEIATHCGKCAFEDDVIGCNKSPACQFYDGEGTIANPYTEDIVPSGWFRLIKIVSTEEILANIGKAI